MLKMGVRPKVRLHRNNKKVLDLETASNTEVVEWMTE